MAQNPSTSEHLCACGCMASVKPGQRWREPACKARIYRRRYRSAQRSAEWEIEARWFQAVDQAEALEGQLADLEDAYHDLEDAYTRLQEAHQHCRRLPPAEADQRPWFGDAYAVLGVRADAELEAIEGAYKALVKKYHPDRHLGDPVMNTRMTAINAAYNEVLRRSARRRKQR